MLDINYHRLYYILRNEKFISWIYFTNEKGYSKDDTPD